MICQQSSHKWGATVKQEVYCVPLNEKKSDRARDRLYMLPYLTEICPSFFHLFLRHTCPTLLSACATRNRKSRFSGLELIDEIYSLSSAPLFLTSTIMLVGPTCALLSYVRGLLSAVPLIFELRVIYNNLQNIPCCCSS